MPTFSNTYVANQIKAQIDINEKLLPTLREGSSKYYQIKSKIEKLKAQLKAVNAVSNRSIYSSSGRIANRDNKIIENDQDISNLHKIRDDLNKEKNQTKTRIGKTVYQWKINSVSKRIDRLNRKKVRMSNRQRFFVSIKYKMSSYHSNKLARKEGKRNYFNNMTNDMANLQQKLSGNPILDKTIGRAVGLVGIYSELRSGRLEQRIETLKEKDKPITFIGANNMPVNVNAINQILNNRKNKRQAQENQTPAQQPIEQQESATPKSTEEHQNVEEPEKPIKEDESFDELSEEEIIAKQQELEKYEEQFLNYISEIEKNKPTDPFMAKVVEKQIASEKLEFANYKLAIEEKLKQSLENVKNNNGNVKS